jgi:hypothetical protein
MYAQITILTKYRLPSRPKLTEALEAHFGKTANPDKIISQTEFKDDPNWAASIIYVHSSGEYIFLVKPRGQHELIIYVENNGRKSQLNLLKKNSEDVIQSIETFLSEQVTIDGESELPNRKTNAHNKISKCEMKFAVELDKILNGYKLSRRDKLVHGFKEHLEAKIYTPLFTLAASWFISFQFQDTLRNTLISLGAIIVWVLIGSFVLFKNPFYYEEPKQ